MFATYVRNSDISENVIYFGPMGCQTGFYLLTRDMEPTEYHAYVDETPIHFTSVHIYSVENTNGCMPRLAAI